MNVFKDDFETTLRMSERVKKHKAMKKKLNT